MDPVALAIRSIGMLSAFALLLYMLNGFSQQQQQHDSLRPSLRWLYRERVLPCTKADPCVIKVIADLDKQSRITDPNNSDELQFKSYLLTGRLFKNGDDSKKYEVNWENEPTLIRGKLNEAGRGMELSELVIFNNALLSFDDRTGVVYELTKDNRAIPRHVITEGDGNNSKGMKIEWATVKDNLLYIGSFGKEYTTPNGSEILNTNNFWVATLDRDGDVHYNDWKHAYTVVRNSVSASFPGYVINEAVNWSPVLKRWVFLPRRVSSESYNEVSDESRGSNLMITTLEDFSSPEVREVGTKTPTRGFSSFKFVPGSHEEEVVALKSEERCETEQSCSQRTFITVLTMTGEVLMDEIELPSKWKYEGIEFIG